jgi:hypothetical protein
MTAESAERTLEPRVEAANPASWEAAVTVRFADGRVTERYQPAYRGSPAAPAQWDDIVAKSEGLIGASALDLATSLTEGDGQAFSGIRCPLAATDRKDPA